MSGGNYSVTGGFWSVISIVQMPGVPNLIIVPNGPGSVTILWPSTGNYTLQQNSNLVTTNRVTSGYGTIKNQPQIMPPQIDNLSL